MLDNLLSGLFSNPLGQNVDGKLKDTVSNALSLVFIAQDGKLNVISPDYVTDISLNNIEETTLKQILLNVYYTMKVQSISSPSVNENDLPAIEEKYKLTGKSIENIADDIMLVWNLVSIKAETEQEQLYVQNKIKELFLYLTSDTYVVNHIKNNTFHNFKPLNYYVLQLLYFSLITSADDNTKSKITNIINKINTKGEINTEDIPFIPIISCHLVAERYKKQAIDENKLIPVDINKLGQLNNSQLKTHN